MRIVVIGAGVAGLGAALPLARAGHDVVLLERDATPLPATADDAFAWRRRGAPQVRHSHAFLARGRNLLRDRLPDVRDALLAAGATEVGWGEMAMDTLTDRSPRPEDDDLVMLCCRRTTFEWVLRRAALDTDRVELRDGVVVTGLLTANGSGPPRVTGVRTDAGDVEADLVVDATGRPSHLPDMLRDVGVELREDRSGTGIVYLSRFYRLREGVEVPNANAFNGADLDYLKFAVMRGDNRTFSITLAYWSDDAEMRTLREPGRFDAATNLLEISRPWVDPDVSEPISGVEYMGNLINRVRYFVEGDNPVVLGLVAVGDTSVCTNPLYGRGCSLGLVHGSLLADAVASHGDDPAELALAFDAATKRELVPWYVAAKGQDAVSIAVHRGEALSEFDAYMRSLIRDGLFPAARTEADVSRAWFRTFNLLGPPEAMLADPVVLQKVLEAWNQREAREPAPPAGPGREGFLDRIGGRT